MEILKIRVALSFKMLQNVCNSGQTIILPIAYDGHKGEERQSYVNVSLEEVQPLGDKGDSFFKGHTVPSNGLAPTFIDGFTSIKSKEGCVHNHGNLMIHDQND